MFLLGMNLPSNLMDETSPIVFTEKKFDKLTDLLNFVTDVDVLLDFHEHKSIYDKKILISRTIDKKVTTTTFENISILLDYYL
jgi:hypothetical protein